jgi:hypothetical protein
MRYQKSGPYLTLSNSEDRKVDRAGGTGSGLSAGGYSTSSTQPGDTPATRARRHRPSRLRFQRRPWFSCEQFSPRVNLKDNGG